MGKYSIYATKQDYAKAYDELKGIEESMGLTLDWKKMKAMHLDGLSTLIRALKNKTITPEPTITKPNVKLVGADSNVYNLMAICIQWLKGVGQGDKVHEFKQRVLNAGSYDEALQIMLEYVDAE